MTSTTRDDILDLIRKLRALGEGTTSEAEALVALRKADRLMTSYAVDEAELAMADGHLAPVEIVSDHLRDIEIQNGRARHKVQAILWQLERYCEVEAVIKSGPVGESYVHIIGTKADTSLFRFLLVFLRESMDRSYAQWQRRQIVTGTGAKASFQTAFAHAVNTRLSDLYSERKAERAAATRDAMALLPEPARDALARAMASGNIKELTSTALVVVSAAERKAEAVRSAYEAEYASARMGRARPMSHARSNGTAWAAGAAAGRSVGLGRPVGAAAAAKAIR